MSASLSLYDDFEDFDDQPEYQRNLQYDVEDDVLLQMHVLREQGNLFIGNLKIAKTRLHTYFPGLTLFISYLEGLIDEFERVLGSLERMITTRRIRYADIESVSQALTTAFTKDPHPSRHWHYFFDHKSVLNDIKQSRRVEAGIKHTLMQQVLLPKSLFEILEKLAEMLLRRTTFGGVTMLQNAYQLVSKFATEVTSANLKNGVEFGVVENPGDFAPVSQYSLSMYGSERGLTRTGAVRRRRSQSPQPPTRTGAIRRGRRSTSAPPRQ
ncbi:hypothetical protein EIN_333920 [Entamoeba invadens IP1]|uniref:Uncharacterized protein n=1 Tax=Entamoeba invadens IP1 TaxID=370355 RepID=A0A0A1UER3_ENTIV|nr:hypothetical protein EIN_333920 [Entamoeba invadens IP1]ELP92425.1 hypothetical protein EIN_333920 [Entamoeba invadens IP1]|eukprot:XP_004259196.1 hypothetical protein EIN_333920 [Entamoeba invadens IP1]